ncbi:MAG TPA: hypothetical protein VM840_00605, partial [Actinomycetota bacterium]|nr:hypothetical protein [Actinomycetota bacterium]
MRRRDTGTGIALRVRAAAAVAGLLALTAPAARAQDAGAPYDHASGAADARTGLISSVMVRTPLPDGLDRSAVEVGVGGLVGRRFTAPSGRVLGTATVDAARLAYADPDADLCIRISAPATPTRPALPNLVEGGGTGGCGGS